MPKGKPAGEEKRWCCLCAYDGTDFAGWQKQPNRRAIQDKIEEVLKETLALEFELLVRGESDAGVHAKGQFFILMPPDTSRAVFASAMRVNFPEGVRPIKLRQVSMIFTRFIRQLERGTAIVHAKVGLNRKLIDLFYPSKKKNRLSPNEGRGCFLCWGA